MSTRTSTNLPQPTPDEQAEQRACVAALSAWLMAATPEDHASRLRLFSAGWAHGRAYEREHGAPAPGEMDALQRTHGEWSAVTFPHQTPDSIVAHLEEEVDELAGRDKKPPHRPEEAADCLLLLFGHAHVLGYSLREAAERKIAINRARKWGTPDANGVVHHTKDDAQTAQEGAA